MSFVCECCVLSSRSIRVVLITRPGESCGASEYDRAFSIMRKLWPTGGRGCCATVKNGNKPGFFFYSIQQIAVVNRSINPLKTNDRLFI